jgi:uncharacterized Zn-binding protein involved in type VI secretion
MYAARFDDPIAHTSAMAGLIGGAAVGLVAGALVGAALVATVATGGLAAPLVIGAALSGAALGAWVGEYLGSLSAFSSIKGKITSGSSNVHVNSKPLSRVEVDIGECKKASPCIPLVATGSSNVFINGFPAVRVDDKMTCGGFIKEGSRNVRIGGGTVAYLPVESEVPDWAHYLVMGAGIVGALLLGGAAAIPAIVGAFVVGSVGGQALGWVGRQYGEWLSETFGGLPSDWEKTGTFGGQALGGWLGAKGGPKAWELANRVEVNPNALGSNFGNIRLRPKPPNSTQLLPGEGQVGKAGDLIATGSKGDNITPHHMPSANHMAKHGVAWEDGIAMNMEHPHPGRGGRHRETFTYGTTADVNMAPRDALAAGVRNARRIYKKDGLYGPYIRQRLLEHIRSSKTTYPKIFKKSPKITHGS